MQMGSRHTEYLVFYYTSSFFFFFFFFSTFHLSSVSSFAFHLFPTLRSKLRIACSSKNTTSRTRICPNPSSSDRFTFQNADHPQNSVI
ncbi:hypothetical protein ACN42_g11529 [Penicillium freii]|uniref:Uncharacterized protein n=1 Tax=Penicillium freii TaxID=48697 RepID=A0A101M874_PENFR|nr:hypothetical protein ACN42_g11529 [Penicillium freii]